MCTLKLRVFGIYLIVLLFAFYSIYCNSLFSQTLNKDMIDWNICSTFMVQTTQESCTNILSVVELFVYLTKEIVEILTIPS